MKLRGDGIRLCVIGLALAALVMATPVWASVPPASSTEDAQSGEVFGISHPTWLGTLWDSLRATAAGGVPSLDLDDHPLVEPESDEHLTISEPSESNTTEHDASIDPDG